MITLALTCDRINAQGGLNLIGKLIERHSGLRERFPADDSKRSDRISDGDILISQLGLLAQGRTHYEDVELFRLPEAREDENFAGSLALDRAPSESILRQRLGLLANDPAVAAQLDAGNLALIEAYGAGALTCSSSSVTNAGKTPSNGFRTPWPWARRNDPGPANKSTSEAPNTTGPVAKTALRSR